MHQSECRTAFARNHRVQRGGTSFTTFGSCLPPSSTLTLSISQSWIGRAQFLVEGVIHEYDPDDPAHQEWTKVKHVPKDHILATLDGCWQKRVYWKRVGDSVGLRE